MRAFPPSGGGPQRRKVRGRGNRAACIRRWVTCLLFVLLVGLVRHAPLRAQPTPQAPPVAAFTAAPTEGLVPLTVTFTNTTAGGYTASRWAFGDGATSPLTHPTHTYTVPGTFTVTLTVTGTGGSDSTMTPALVEVSAVTDRVFLPLLMRTWPANVPPTGAPPRIAGCSVFPADSVWNTPVDTLPVHPESDAYIAAIGLDAHVHADFGAGTWPPGSGSPIGIPYVAVPGTQPGVAVTFGYDDESDPGPYPIPDDPPIEGGPDSDGDRHVLIVDHDACVLYELYAAYPQPDGSWHAGSGAVFDLGSHALRPAGWTSADAAGLPILPGLVRYDEVAAGEVRHALRFTAPRTQNTYLWPARHHAGRDNAGYPPMGLRVRLKPDVDISGFPSEVQVILRALKTYGMMLADNGSAWYLSGVPDDRWDNNALHALHHLDGDAFEAVDVASLMVDSGSGRVRR